ncbi:DNA replication/repair protein RecF [Paenibacillus hemerocallicola]|uniref:DNA replication and repair protein RecF n=1 Tax=Paenibacillus hemerocallicola TaxID=1172614 RepID=A0A5C4SZZ0_9BACL|nr:DNA replication/repair protein RecF [Paenibacillus hemerocallicola]TNJ62085.1 DNA replication/repair protein RecF [Paenibacillus hemerocallicola]
MYLKKLSLRDYRNYESIEFATEGAVNLFVGPNAQGKTNLLEAIFVLALTKSHRTHQDKELIRWGADRTMLRAELDKKYGPCTLDLTFTNQGKKASINGLEQKKLSGFIGALNVVMFAPEDLSIVKGAPGVRRRFLDMEIGQVQPSYLHDLSQYQKVLVQRNNMLKQSFRQSQVNGALMEVWNEQLVGLSIKIMKKRQNFINKLQIWAESIHRGITNGLETLAIEYKPSFAYDGSVEDSVLFEQFMIKLSQAKDQEIRRSTTLYGPHRDDLAFFINGKDVQTFGSQGQQRTTALSLKLAEIEFIQEEVGEYPILLLDDVLSELDTYRQTQLLETFQTKVQTFITTTGVESLQMNRLENASIFHVRNGQLVLA